MLKVCKFGGSSLCDAAHFMRVREIVLSDVSRRVVVVSAAGKRHSADHKITDLLYLCHAHLQYHVSCHELWRRIAGRYIEIRDGCGLYTPIEQSLDQIYAALNGAMMQPELASRGEYLSARLMADLLGFSFVDAAQWLQFDSAGNVLTDASYAALASLADGRKIVTPGFYGVLPSGAIHTFSRGGSDVTGALAAAALGADVYENWTDVNGILAADPHIIQHPQTVPQLTFGELQALSAVGMQVLHESAVAPVRQRQIPLHIRSTAHPEQAGTLIRSRCEDCAASSGAIALAGRRGLSMLRLELSSGADCSIQLAEANTILRAAGLRVFHSAVSLGQQTFLLDAPRESDTLHAAAETITRTLQPVQLRLRENLAVLAALCRGAGTASGVLDAVQRAGVPVHHLAQAASCLLMTVNDSQYEAALRAAYPVLAK